MKQRTVILVSMSSRADWQEGILNKKFQHLQAGVVNRNFHILQTMLKRPEIERVISVDFLPFTLRKSIKQVMRTRLWRSTPETQDRGLTWRVDAITPKWWSVSALRAKDVAHLKRLVVPGTEVVVWSYHPFFPEIFQQYPTAKKVFDTVDNWSEHTAYIQYQQRLKKNYVRIDKTADVIFTVSPDLKKVFPENTHVYWVPNGVDVQHFRQPSNNQQFNLLPKPFVVYCGVIQERFDLSLVEQTARLLPNIHFVIAGPIWEGINLASLHLPNVHLIGSVDYQQLPSLLARASCGIIPHIVNRFTASMNPLKLYEYLAAGLPVISTPVKGTEQFPTGVTVASTPPEFATAIKKAIAYSSEQKKQLTSLVTEHTWETRLDTMLSYLA